MYCAVSSNARNTVHRLKTVHKFMKLIVASTACHEMTFFIGNLGNSWILSLKFTVYLFELTVICIANFIFVSETSSENVDRKWTFDGVRFKTDFPPI